MLFRSRAKAHNNSGPACTASSIQTVATITAGSAVPSSASPDKFGAVPPERNARAPQTTGDLSADRLSPVSSNAAGSQAATTVATSATPPAKAHQNSGPVDATGSFPPVVTITAGSAVPFSASPDKFPAVSVASISLHSKGGVSSMPPAEASENIPLDTSHLLALTQEGPLITAVSNREHVELGHAATR